MRVISRTIRHWGWATGALITSGEKDKKNAFGGIAEGEPTWPPPKKTPNAAGDGQAGKSTRAVLTTSLTLAEWLCGVSTAVEQGAASPGCCFEKCAWWKHGVQQALPA